MLREPHVVVAPGEGADAAIVVGLLRRHGFRVEVATDARVALDTAAGVDGPDVALVDLGLREPDPLVLVETLTGAGVPTAVVGGRHPDDRAAAEARGADAFLVRPIVAADLLATLRSLAQSPPVDVLRFGPMEVDVGGRRVVVGDRRVHLAPREFDLLVHLARSPGRVFGPEGLLEDVWHVDPDRHDPGTVAVHVRRIRLKLDAAGMGPCIRTVKGRGYAFTAGGEGRNAQPGYQEP